MKANRRGKEQVPDLPGPSVPGVQASLFESWPLGSNRDPETGPKAPRRHRQASAAGDELTLRLGELVSRLDLRPGPRERIELAGEIRGIAELIVADVVQGARQNGSTWRQLGQDLAIPFQTLFRRFGGLPGLDGRSRATPTSSIPKPPTSTGDHPHDR